MNESTIAEQLDLAIDALRVNPEDTMKLSLDISELLGIVAELRILPRPEFKAQLRADVVNRAGERREIPAHASSGSALEKESLPIFVPTLLDAEDRGYAMHLSFAASFLAQAAVLALCIGLAIVTMHRDPMRRQFLTSLLAPENYILPAAKTQSGGGGGGGDRDKLRASRGALPRLAKEQVVPPTVVVRNQDPKLVAQPTVVAPPDIAFRQDAQLGDPLASMLTPSNGVGSGGGVGSGHDGGVGSGDGAGIGPGRGAGLGGGVFRVGGGVSAPRAIYDPEPEYSDEARKAKLQGSVVLLAVIGANGQPRDLHIIRSLGMGLDEKAMATVRKWRFEPAMKDGQPVAVLVNVEVDFRLY